VDNLRRAAWSGGRAGVVRAVVVTALTACDAGGSAEEPTARVSSTPPGQAADPSGEPTTSSSTPVVKPRRAAMPEVPMRFMSARGTGSEAVLVSAAGIAGTGRSASAYVATRTARGSRPGDAGRAGRGPAVPPGRGPEGQPGRVVAGPTRLARWLGNATFGVLTSSGTWRHPSVAASVCRVAGRCQVVWRLRLGPDDSGLSDSNEIG
jgi:hypothetical protein